MKFVAGTRNPADYSSKKMDLKVFLPDYWKPSVLVDSDVKELNQLQKS